MTAEHRVDLSGRSTLRLAATADSWCEVDSDEALREQLAIAREQDQRVLPVGEGSNIAFCGHISARLIHQRCDEIQVLREDGDYYSLRVAAGYNWHRFVGWALDHELCGLENLALIPGTVGAAPIQNIGAYGVELAAFVEAVHAISLHDLTPLQLSAKDCEFGYRDSVFKHALRDRVVITAVDFRLPRQASPVFDYPDLQRELASIESPEARQVYDAVIAIRQRKLPDPTLTPNAGSFFKNPVLSVGEVAYKKLGFSTMPVYPVDDNYRKVPAAWLIDQCGLKGCREGEIGVHEGHALVLVNHGKGTGEQLLVLVERIQQTVFQRFGIELEVEPRIYRD